MGGIFRRRLSAESCGVNGDLGASRWRQEARPCIHQFTATIQKITPGIGRFNAHDHVSESHFRDLTRPAIIASPVSEGGSKTVRHCLHVDFTQQL